MGGTITAVVMAVMATGTSCRGSTTKATKTNYKDSKAAIAEINSVAKAGNSFFAPPVVISSVLLVYICLLSAPQLLPLPTFSFHPNQVQAVQILPVLQ